jgi:colicin import membrane protein
MKSKTKGIVVSFVVHITIIVLLILFGFSTPLPLPGEEGILINFGTDDFGSGLREPRPSPRERVQQVQQTPDREEQASLTQDFEEAPSIPNVKPVPVKPKEEEKKPIEKPKEEVKPVEEKPREVDRRTLFPGQKPTGDTSGEGSTGSQGNQGDAQGSTDSQNREGGTVSGGDGISFSLGGRAALSLPQPDYPSQKSGSVVVEVTVDRNGNVTNVRGGVRGSTTYDTQLINAAEVAARRARFDVSPNAPAYQTGTITYVFKLQ